MHRQRQVDCTTTTTPGRQIGLLGAITILNSYYYPHHHCHRHSFESSQNTGYGERHPIRGTAVQPVRGLL